MAQRDGRRCLAELLGDPFDDGTEQMGEQGLGPVRRPAKDDRRRIAETTLELATGPRRLGECPALGRLAGEDLAIGPQQHDRWDRRGAFTELEDLQSVGAGDSRRGIGRPEVDPE